MSSRLTITLKQLLILPILLLSFSGFARAEPEPRGFCEKVIAALRSSPSFGPDWADIDFLAYLRGLPHSDTLFFDHTSAKNGTTLVYRMQSTSLEGLQDLGNLLSTDLNPKNIAAGFTRKKRWQKIDSFLSRGSMGALELVKAIQQEESRTIFGKPQVLGLSASSNPRNMFFPRWGSKWIAKKQFGIVARIKADETVPLLRISSDKGGGEVALFQAPPAKNIDWFLTFPSIPDKGALKITDPLKSRKALEAAWEKSNAKTPIPQQGGLNPELEKKLENEIFDTLTSQIKQGMDIGLRWESSYIL